MVWDFMTVGVDYAIRKYRGIGGSGMLLCSLELRTVLFIVHFALVVWFSRVVLFGYCFRGCVYFVSYGSGALWLRFTVFTGVL